MPSPNRFNVGDIVVCVRPVVPPDIRLLAATYRVTAVTDDPPMVRVEHIPPGAVRDPGHRVRPAFWDADRFVLASEYMISPSPQGQPASSAIRVGDVLRYRAPDNWRIAPNDREDHALLVDGQVVQVTEVRPYSSNRTRFRCRPYRGFGPLPYSASWWYTAHLFTPVHESEFASLELEARRLRHADNLRRREIECPKVNLP